MAKTREQTQFKVIAILTGGDVGFNPSDEDKQNIDGYIDAMVDELAADEVMISDADAIDNAIWISFCKLVADAAAEEYGAKSDPKVSTYFRNRIRVLTRERPGFSPQEVQYF